MNNAHKQPPIKLNPKPQNIHRQEAKIKTLIALSAVSF
jgi:hypothetical protein